jgi:hypothetical protein
MDEIMVNIHGFICWPNHTCIIVCDYIVIILVTFINVAHVNHLANDVHRFNGQWKTMWIYIG